MWIAWVSRTPPPSRAYVPRPGWAKYSGGRHQRIVADAERIFPSFPARSRPASSSAAGRKRCWKTIASVRPARSQALDEGRRALGVRLDRLLEQDVLARRCGLRHELGVRPRRREDEHRVDRLVAEDGLERVDGAEAPRLRRLLAPLARRRERRRDFDAIGEVLQAERMGLERHAEPDDADAVLHQQTVWCRTRQMPSTSSGARFHQFCFEKISTSCMPR